MADRMPKMEGYDFIVSKSKNGNDYYQLVCQFPTVDGGEPERFYAFVDFSKARLIGLPSLNRR